ncbi:hypothetical protein [Roseomonas populi]|uniref:Uncharacterized protein n=1 Tax=Roseomonas populi TaxID=3121582 RepID=A0ABT1XEF8_9PROT|nr:hypothetical protein [Roseomonas pecuniae]MCR0985833.1 hypothetical protein [Roseomonas pecuniae]
MRKDLDKENRHLPTIPHHAPDRPIRLRAALASTFVAGLELAKDGMVTLEQAEPFGVIALASKSITADQAVPP